MRRVLLLLLGAALVAAASLWIASLPGAVRFEAGSLSIGTATPTLVFAMLLALALCYAAIRLLGLLFGLRARARSARARRRRRQGDSAVTRSLVALAAGQQSDALTHAARARKMLGDTPQTLLLAAQAHRLAGSEAEAAAHFTTLAAHPDAALIGLRGLLRQATARQDWAEAEALADRADRAHPNSAWLREERARLAVRGGDWKRALSLADAQAPRLAYTAGAAAAAENPAEGIKLARAAFKAQPGFAPAAVGYATRLTAAGAIRKARSVLRTAWTAQPHPAIAAAALAGLAGTARLDAARQLTARTAEHPEALLVLGRAALEAGDLATARDAADRLRTMLDQHRVWTLVADVEQRIHPDSAAARAARERAATAGADPAWRCDRCGHRQDPWAPKCDQCGTPGALAWS